MNLLNGLKKLSKSLTKNRSYKKISFFATSVFLFVLLLGYNNCSQQGNSFGTSAALLADLKDPYMVIEDKRSATNKRVLKVNFYNFHQVVHGVEFKSKSMKVGIEGQLDSLSWVPYQDELFVDLNRDYAPDGTQDGFKYLAADVLGEDGSIVHVKNAILLDTLPPKGTASGLMAQGLTSGQVYQKGNSVPITWSAQDPFPPSGPFFSGLYGPHAGISVGWSLTGDCSDFNLKEQTSWGAFSFGYPFIWPQSSPLETFFICVLVRDEAGNISTILSQPMSAVWAVVAGDNNLGNGGSPFAANVRFGYPTKIQADSKGQIFVYDSFTEVLRTIKLDGEGMIQHFLGNGGTDKIVETNNMSSVPLTSMTGLAFDSSDNLYFTNADGLWRVIRDPLTGDPLRVENLFAGDLRTLFIRKLSSGDELYLSRFNNIMDGRPLSEAQAYIFKIKIKELEDLRQSLGRVPSYESLLPDYVLVGNGDVWLTSSSPFAYSKAMDPKTTPAGYVVGLTVDDQNGDVYFTSVPDGYQRGYGGSSLRILRQTAEGPKVFLLSSGNSVGWKWGLSIVPVGDQEKYLLATGDISLRRFRIDQLQLPLAKALPLETVPEDIKEYSFSAAVIMKMGSTNLIEPLILVAHSSAGQVVQIASDFSKSLARIGRPLFSNSDLKAKESVLANPAAVSEDANGQLYIFESISNIIRKVSQDGGITLFAGQPDGVEPINYDSPYNTVALKGTFYESGYRYQMAYDDVNDTLYMGNGRDHSINQFLIQTQTYRKIDFTSEPYTSDLPDSWATYGLALDRSSGDPRLWIYRSSRYSPYGAMGMRASQLDSDVVTQEQLFGNTSVGSPAPNFILNSSLTESVSIATDSQGAVYFATAGKLWRYRDATLKALVTSGFGNGPLVVIQENDMTHVIVSRKKNFIRHVAFDASDKVKTDEALCLPGSYLNAPGQFVSSHDGNILIADTKNNRILKYFIRSSSGQLQFVSTTGTGSCQ